MGQSVLVDERLAANRANWDDRTGIHLDSAFYDVEGWVRRAPGPRTREIDALGDVAGLSLVHLQCHIGLDTLQFARAGARVTGLDFSPAAITAAQDLADRSGLTDQSHFVCADVYDSVNALGSATFDIVYVSLGALCWLPSVDRWAEQVAALLTPGGRLYLHDMHPVEWALADDEAVFAHPYFEETDPYVDDSESTYTDSDRPLVNRRSYQWNHSLGEIVTAVIRHGLTLDSLIEHDWTVRPRFHWLVANDKDHWTTPAGMPRLPLSFSLLAHRATAS
jgi:SAM-dependent methyltransferase